MTERIIDNELRLIPYYRNDEASLPWYQDLDVCRQVDNREKPYDVELLHRMYDYLTAHGDCYYIEYKGVLVGDVSLRENSEIAVVVCTESAYWKTVRSGDAEACKRKGNGAGKSQYLFF